MLFFQICMIFVWTYLLCCCALQCCLLKFKKTLHTTTHINWQLVASVVTMVITTVWNAIQPVWSNRQS